MITLLNQKNEESSETIRKATFNFDAYLDSKPSHLSKINSTFLAWFIGFAEGDGCFFVDEKTNRNYFLLSQKDPKALYYIKKNLGFGIVNKKKDSYQYYVSDQINIDKLIKIFNGNLQLEKTNRNFKKWFIVYNNYTKITNKVSFNDNLNKSLSLDNSWISGFIDAEGCFTATLRVDPRYKSGYKLVLRFIIDQKLEDDILLYIGELFGKQKISARKEIDGMSRLVLHSNFDHLISYLSRFSLKTNKKLSYLRWKRLFFYIKQENLLATVQNEKAFAKLKNLIKNLNTPNMRLKVEDRVRPI